VSKSCLRGWLVAANDSCDYKCCTQEGDSFLLESGQKTLLGAAAVLIITPKVKEFTEYGQKLVFCRMLTLVGLSPGDIVLDGYPLPPK